MLLIRQFVPLRRAVLCTALLAAPILVAGANSAAAQSSRAAMITARDAARDADLAGDWSALVLARQRLARLAADPDVGVWARYHTAYADWRLASLAWMGAGPAGQLPLLMRAASQLDSVIAAHPTLAEAHALLASCLGAALSADPSHRDALIPRLVAAARAAAEHGSANPRVQLLRVMGDFARAAPASEEQRRAMSRWREVIALFEGAGAATDALAPTWGRAEALAWLGGAHLIRGEHGEARARLEEALQLRPDFWWARVVALPQATDPACRCS